MIDYPTLKIIWWLLVGVLLVGGYLACRPRYLEDTWHE